MKLFRRILFLDLIVTFESGFARNDEGDSDDDDGQTGFFHDSVFFSFLLKHDKYLDQTTPSTQDFFNRVQNVIRPNQTNTFDGQTATTGAIEVFSDMKCEIFFFSLNSSNTY